MRHRFVTLPTGDYTVIAIAASDSPTVTKNITGGNIGASTRMALQTTTSSLKFVSASSGSTGAALTRTADSNPHICIGTRSGTALEVIQDGGTNIATGSDASNASLTVVDWGRGGTGTNVYDGRMGQIMYFNRKLSHSELNSVCAALGTKWGITWTNL
jgi:hypothetical protein